MFTAMLALSSSVLMSPRLGKHQKKADGNTTLELPTSTPSSDKRRRLGFSLSSSSSQVGVPLPTIEPSVSETSASATSNELYTPRRSKLVEREFEGDEDTWIECLVVNIKDKKGKKNTTRSLFYSVETQRGTRRNCSCSWWRVLVCAHCSFSCSSFLGWWDEPPSGASNVVYVGQGRGLEVVPKKR